MRRHKTRTEKKAETSRRRNETSPISEVSFRAFHVRRQNLPRCIKAASVKLHKPQFVTSTLIVDLDGTPRLTTIQPCHGPPAGRFLKDK